jgi:Ca2+/Na+ antiporter
MDKKNSSLYITAGVATGFWRQPISRSVAVGASLFTLLNLVDAFTTLYATSFGAEELNPLMRAALVQGPFSFFFAKYLMVAMCILVIAACCRRTRKARQVLFYVFLPVYLFIVTHNIVLIIIN